MKMIGFWLRSVHSKTQMSIFMTIIILQFTIAFCFLTETNYTIGQIHTYNNPNLLEAVNVKDGKMFLLYPNATYLLWVHDPNYFILTGRPLVFPGIFRKYKV